MKLNNAMQITCNIPVNHLSISLRTTNDTPPNHQSPPLTTD